MREVSHFIFILILVSFYAEVSEGFFAKWWDNPKEYCANVIPKSCENCSDKMPDIFGQEIPKFGYDFKELSDLTLAFKLDERIVLESEEQLGGLKTLSFDLAQNIISERAKKFNQTLETILHLKSQMEVVKNFRINCKPFRGRSGSAKGLKRCEENQKKYDEQFLIPLQKSMLDLYHRFPIFLEEKIQSFIDGEVHTHFYENPGSIKKYRQSTALASGELRDKLLQDTMPSYDRKKAREISLSGILKGMESLRNLKDRHEKQKMEIQDYLSKKGSKENIKNFRDRLLAGKSDDSRRLVADYASVIEENEMKQNSAYAESVCRIVKEHEGNLDNSFYNSLLLDLGVLLIPIGGEYLLSGKVLQKLLRAEELSTEAIQAGRLGVLSFDLLASGVALNDLVEESRHCKEIEADALVLASADRKALELRNQCQSLRDNMALYTSLSVVGGVASALGTYLGSAIKYKKFSQVRSERLLDYEMKKVALEGSEGARGLSPDLKDGIIRRYEVELKTFSPQDKELTLELISFWEMKEGMSVEKVRGRLNELLSHCRVGGEK